MEKIILKTEQIEYILRIVKKSKNIDDAILNLSVAPMIKIEPDKLYKKMSDVTCKIIPNMDNLNNNLDNLIVRKV